MINPEELLDKVIEFVNYDNILMIGRVKEVTYSDDKTDFSFYVAGIATFEMYVVPREYVLGIRTKLFND